MWMLSSLLEKESLQCLCKSCQCPELQFVLSSSSNSNWHVFPENIWNLPAEDPEHLLPTTLSGSTSKWGLVLYLKNQTQRRARARQILCSTFCSATPQGKSAESEEPRFWLWQLLAVTAPGWLLSPVYSKLNGQKAGNSWCCFACTSPSQQCRHHESHGTHKGTWPSQESGMWCQKLVTYKEVLQSKGEMRAEVG